MSENGTVEYVVEPQKRVPVAYDVDVVVIGAGIGGLFAALAAGKQGAKTLLIDRLAALGGNIGPAMIVAGGLYNEADGTLVGGLSGIPKWSLTWWRSVARPPPTTTQTKRAWCRI